jgi:hypothetical protein
MQMALVQSRMLHGKLTGLGTNDAVHNDAKISSQAGIIQGTPQESTQW